MNPTRWLPGLVLIALKVGAVEPVPLPGTQLLTWTGDLSTLMHEAAHRDVEKVIADSVQTRQRFWHRDFSSPAAYEQSIAGNRERFSKIIGLVDQRVPVVMERFGDDANPALVAETATFRVYQVRWPVLDGVNGEGLLLEPKGAIAGFVVAVPDADQTPEQFIGLAHGAEDVSYLARGLAENGFAVIVPVLIDRADTASGNPKIAMTNMPHREWIYRQAYMMGRHIIGYEVQKVLAAVDWWEKRRAAEPALKATKIGVAGYGEGGLIAFYAAAVDTRIQAALVSGYFKSRQTTWEEPLYRNVWGLLREFGDAEIASLIAPRGLLVERTDEPKVDGPPPAEKGRKNCAAPGRLETPRFVEVKAEFDRIESLILAGWQQRMLASPGSDVPSRQGSRMLTLTNFAAMLGVNPSASAAAEEITDRRRAFDPTARQLRQVAELENHVQRLVQLSEHVRDEFFLYKLLPQYKSEPWTMQLRFPPLEPEAFVQAAKEYRRNFWEEVIGRIDDPLPPFETHSRKIYDEPLWTGYDVVLKVGDEGFAWGVLCLPKNLKPGEKRPVVVCQHGRHGVPKDVIEGDTQAYHNFAARLAERGFITFAPHNLYQKEALYRMLSRKGNTVKLSMFSFILRHHEQDLKWLKSLPYVDPQRIAFYGLSYGGETAVRVPPLLDDYCLSICSGDFNDWTRKVAATDDRHSFMFTDEWEMPYFNMGSTFSYAELTYLMFPRPFMAERGHHDGVAPDQWVAHEFAKTRWFYAQFGMADRTAIEFFNGGHTINGQGTFDFLHQHLNWPKP